MGDKRPDETSSKEEPKKQKLEKTMDQAEGELDTVEEALRQRDKDPSETRHQRG
jgi:hypothetical protein